MRAISTFAQHHAHPAVAFAGGFTAVELMVTIAILAILSALAAPSFTNLFHSWRVRQAADALQHSLHLARSEAIKRGGNVFLQKLPNTAGSCASATGNKDWGCGWQICHDTNASGNCDATDAVLHYVAAPGPVLITRSAVDNQAARIKFDRWGKVAGAWPSFGIRPHGQADTHPAARRLCMGSGGRIRITPDIAC